MGRFSCFYGHVYGHKQKKSGQPSFETMVKMLQLGSQNNESEKTVDYLALRNDHIVKNEPSNLGSGTRHLSLASHSCKSGELKCDDDAESNAGFVHFESGNLRRSLSVGCEMDQKQGFFGSNNDDDCILQDISCEVSEDCDDTAEVMVGAKSMGTSLPDQDQEVPQSVSPQLSSNLVNHEPLFAVDNPQYLSKEGHEESHLSLYAEYHNDSCCKSPTQCRISKCNSMPNFGSMSMSPGLTTCFILSSRSRSFEDLNVLSKEQENASAQEANAVKAAELNRVDGFYNPEKFDGENVVLDTYDSCSYGCSSKGWIVPMQNEIDIMRHGEGNSSGGHWDCFTNKDFKIKQIEDWVINLQHCGPLEETDKVADSGDEVKRASAFIDDLSKVEVKVNPCVEAAKRYVSSLNATTTSVQLANYGLLAIPLLSAFVSLKVLNLSGNSIVRITVGVLPRGLHMLNLSKNKIATIEGLRELTRLRVLDLSYNKISRIGHGLASCSTLKELYLAGNKISEVEGLHRLLKLTVLDLRFNKIATSKCLGQLAANYNTLQAISLEGNPAQKNVGDEQLKKNLLGLLPHLAYYNRHNIKTSTLKDSSDRAVRLGISDRGLRSDHKLSRWGSGVPKRPSHSSTHGQKGQASEPLKQSKGKRVSVLPSGTKSSHRHPHFEVGNKLQSLRSGLSLHKSRSEGTLAAL